MLREGKAPACNALGDHMMEQQCNPSEAHFADPQLYGEYDMYPNSDIQHDAYNSTAESS